MVSKLFSRFAHRYAAAPHQAPDATTATLMLAFVCLALTGCRLSFFGAKNTSFVYRDKTMVDTNFQLPASSLQGSGNLSAAEMGLNLIAQCYHYPNGNGINEKAIRFGTLVGELRLESPGLVQSMLGLMAGLGVSMAGEKGFESGIGALNMRRALDAKMLQDLDDIRIFETVWGDSEWRILSPDRTPRLDASAGNFFMRKASGPAQAGSIPVELAYMQGDELVRKPLDLSRAESLEELRPLFTRNGVDASPGVIDGVIKRNVKFIAEDFVDPKILTIRGQPIRQITLFGQTTYDAGDLTHIQQLGI